MISNYNSMLKTSKLLVNFGSLYMFFIVHSIDSQRILLHESVDDALWGKRFWQQHLLEFPRTLDRPGLKPPEDHRTMAQKMAFSNLHAFLFSGWPIGTEHLATEEEES